MNVQVWADVGGTFTDCLIQKNGHRQTLKLLSSGRVRLRCWPTQDPNRLRCDSIPAHAVQDFWVGASAWYLQPDGEPRSLGEVIRQDSSELEFAVSPPRGSENLQNASRPGSNSTEASPIVVELDARLESPVLATRILLGVPLADALPNVDVRLGTTRGTNALLTRGGANTGLLVTRGFGDVLRIGEQDRPELFSLAIDKPDPLTNVVVEIDERLDAQGSVLQPLDTEQLTRCLAKLRSNNIDSIAICFLHAHVNDQHERVAEALAQAAGFTNVSRSSEVAPLIKLVFRAETTTLDAYLNPILAGYVARVWQQFGGESNCRFRLMTSGGNLVAPEAFRGRDSILSGPAGGVVGLAHVAETASADAAIGLDMGGTSTDVSRFDGSVGRRYESRVAGIRVMTPMMDIETVAAGGGSICRWTPEGRLAVGPSSAGADPGPACYGRGGPLTITDVNYLLGRIPEAKFPFPLHRDASQKRLDEVLTEIPPSSRFRSHNDLAEGFLDIAVTHMAEAVRTVSTSKGSDVREMALVGFGGAAGQHLCRVADVLGMTRILDHPDSSILSAVGIGLANIGRTVTRGVYRPLNRVESQQITAITESLKRETEDLLQTEHMDSTEIAHQLQFDLRYVGTESPLAIELGPLDTLADRFHRTHHQTFGYAQHDREIELVAIRCESTLQSQQTLVPSPDAVREEPVAARSEPVATGLEPAVGNIEPPSSVELWHRGGWLTADHIDRASLRPDQPLDGPAVISGPNSTLVVEPGWRAQVISEQIIELTPNPMHPKHQNPSQSFAADDPVLLEVAARRWQGIADSMGEVLRRTSISVNVKERRDYSCAVFRGDGSLVANAPHVPVHLGAMGHTVRHLMEVFPEMSSGDCYLSNDPYCGGSHLPDVTAVTPVFCEGPPARGKPDFFIASRAHHAEIGGRTPGSMPPDATSLLEEGVVIRDFPLIRFGEVQFEQLRALLASGPYPSRCIDENIADITAQQAAGIHGSQALAELTRQYSFQTIDGLMGRLLDVAQDGISTWIKSLPNEPMRFRDALDDGTTIGVSIQRFDDRLQIKFDTGGVHANGFNATPAIVTATVLYVLRSVSGSDLPLCDGVLKQVDLEIPEGLLDPPFHDDPQHCAAVVAGNVETSQRIVDTLLGALGVAAASQGTMNNVLFGDATFGYYETIGGGSGACEGHAGAHAVHTHMTNTRITDPEVLELRLPIRVRQFAIRTDSGGAGRYRGGDGIIREFELLKPLVVSLITGRRTRRPYGAAGGKAGESGVNQWIKSAGTVALPPTATIQTAAGDRLLIATPGGGGWGEA